MSKYVYNRFINLYSTINFCVQAYLGFSLDVKSELDIPSHISAWIQGRLAFHEESQ